MRENSRKELIDHSTLRDIRDVRIDETLPREERIRSFVEQIGDPYHYLDGDIVVSIGYADTQVSLQDRLRSYVSMFG